MQGDIRSRIDGEFEGFDDEVVFKLANGTYWLQDEYKYWYHYAYMPAVLIQASGSSRYLSLDGYEKRVRVRQIINVVESAIEGEFNGWEGETKYTLRSGQVWQQAVYHYHYCYAFCPEVLIYEASGGHKMSVCGTCVEVKRVA